MLSVYDILFKRWFVKWIQKKLGSRLQLKSCIKYDCETGEDSDGAMGKILFRIEGLRDEILFLQEPGGEKIPILPMAIATVVERHLECSVFR
jgi:hypothetical protein